MKRTPAFFITMVCSLMWAATFVVRIWKPDWPLGAQADAMMALIVGYYFTRQAGDKNPQEETAS